LAGILPLFPAFAPIVLVIGRGGRAKMPGSGNPAPVRKTFPAFLAVCYFAVGRIDYRIALIGGACRLVRGRAWHFPRAALSLTTIPNPAFPLNSRSLAAARRGKFRAGRGLYRELKQQCCTTGA
jgi:hypothetical protein